MTMKETPVVNAGKAATPLTFRLEHLLARDWLVAGILFVLALVSRLPFQSQILYHWDSVNFSYAIQEFNLAKEQPQPPGYIVYVWLSRLVDAFVHDAQMTLVSISIVASALAIVAMFYLGRSMFGSKAGLLAALFLATSPLFWFYGEIALPHTLDTLLVIVSVWWLYEIMHGNYRYFYPMVVVVAIAGGVRQQTLVFLFPLILFALRRVGWRRFLLAGLVGGLLCLAWFVPLMILSGGVSNYMRVMDAFSARFQTTTSIFAEGGWWGLRRNVLKLSLYTLYAWGLALLPAALFGLKQLRQRAWPQNWEKSMFLLLWLAPALAFYTFIHMGQQGLVFVFLPALLLFSAVGLTYLLAHQPNRLVVATTALAALNIIIFCLVPEYPLGPGSQRLLTRETLVNSNHYYQDRFEAIKQNFAPASTLILAANWHHVEYYLPEYRHLPFNIGSKWEQDEGLPEDTLNETLVSSPAKLGLNLNAHGRAVIVVFDPDLNAFDQTPMLVKKLTLPDGGELAYLELGPDDQFYLKPDSYGVFSK